MALSPPLPVTNPNNLTSQLCTSLSQQTHVSSWTPVCLWPPSPSPLCSLCLGPTTRALSYPLGFTFSPGSLSPMQKPQPHHCLADRLGGRPSPFPIWVSYLHYIIIINFKPMMTKPEEWVWKEMWRGGKKGLPVYSGVSRGSSAGAYTTHNPRAWSRSGSLTAPCHFLLLLKGIKLFSWEQKNSLSFLPVTNVNSNSPD